MSKISGRVAVVTGAGSGIGRALALELARRGARLALSDVNVDGVAETAAEAEKLGTEAIHSKLDVSDNAAFVAYANEVQAHFGVVNQLYNNAGIAFLRTIAESNVEDYERVLGVNLFGVIHGTKAFLPHLIASNDGHVTNISSMNGFMAQPEMSAYVTSKFAVRGFTETLRMEMKNAGSPVRVTVVHPGGIATAIATNASNAQLAAGDADDPKLAALAEQRTQLYNKKFLKMPASKAAEIIVNGVEKNKPRVLVGSDAKAIDGVVRLAPALSPGPIAGYFKRMYR